SFVIRRDEPIPFSILDQFLRSLQGYRGPDLLRIKGLVYLRDSPARPTVIHGVQGQMHPPTTLKRWPTSTRKTELVFITRGISHQDVENLLSGIEKGFR
ncbi:MAG: GTP-binding protein, partial [Kofleriaceae bacterium]|nr:GTP-binding protein [Kofleriaceae bacterium]